VSSALRYSPLLVTGGSGFVGACIVRRALAEGYEVHVLLRRPAPPWRLQDVLPRLNVHRADVMDAAAVNETLARVRPRAVLHLATHGAYEPQDDARRILETNVIGGYNVVHAAIAAGCAVVVNAGSSSEYGYRDTAMNEVDALRPNSIYAVAKAAQTHMCTLLGSASEATAVVTFRLFSVYGPWEEPTRLLPTIIRRARAGLPLEMAARDIARDFVYVDDVVDAFLGLERLEGLRGEVFNLGSGIQSTLAEVVETVLDTVGRRSEVRWGAMAARRWDTVTWKSDPGKACRVLGWTARHTLRSGVARMAEWIESMGSRYGAA
jgi:nucleoside-diphosphate-sugar epimerase